ncbi:hypothetical protein F5Y16DRAFT_416236 [Xylariaceae sp. FL0255]|nr:hypothetical protein F5Y16DRAFT_416236 [Xylariaceae sp. FL0255]
MNPTIVICYGAWPLASFFASLIEAFRARHFIAVCEPPEDYPAIDCNSGINPDALYLRNHILTPLIEQEKDVVIFMHSYGGVYGPEALQGFSKKDRAVRGQSGGVIAVIFNAAFIATKGATAIEATGLDPENLPDYLNLDRSTNLVSFKTESAKAMLFHDLPDSEAQRLVEFLPRQPFACFNTAGIELTHWMKNSSYSPHHEQPDVLARVVIDVLRNIMTKDRP